MILEQINSFLFSVFFSYIGSDELVEIVFAQVCRLCKAVSYYSFEIALRLSTDRFEMKT